MKTTLTLLLLCAAFSTCLATDPPPQSKKPQLTVAQAKDTLLRFIRAHRQTFVGDPDPDKLAGLPVQALGEGRYALGAFQIDLPNLSYSAAIGVEGPAPFFYSGSFTPQDDGTWTATAPDVQHPLAIPNPPK